MLTTTHFVSCDPCLKSICRSLDWSLIIDTQLGPGNNRKCIKGHKFSLTVTD